MKRLFVIVLALLALTGLSAKIIKRGEVNESNLAKMAGSVYAYQAPTEPLTPAPKGFKPVYLTHFGRHGSRFWTMRPTTTVRTTSSRRPLTPVH